VSSGSAGAGPGDQPLPLVRPWMLRDDDLCPVRVRFDLERRRTTTSRFNQGRLLDALKASVIEAHDELRVPERRWFVAPERLFSEERAVWDVAVTHYLERFGEVPARTARGEVDQPDLRKRQVALGGTAPLAFDLDDGIEVRRLVLSGRREPCADPVRDADSLLVVLRLARWMADRPLRVVAVDLATGAADTAVVLPGSLADLGALLDERLAALWELADLGDARPGVACGWCIHAPACPAHRAAVPVLS
jgi:hypothetical protein